MSYARWSDESDVYVFFNSGGFYECCHCRIPAHEGKTDSMVETAAEMIRHLDEHKDRGDRVPEDAVKELMMDMAYEVGDE